MTKEKFKNSIGIVKEKLFTFANKEAPFTFINGATIPSITLAYETYGTLNSEKNNAILILHALSGTAHAAGLHSKEDKHPGWWENHIGPNKPFDTNKYFIISSNVIAGCDGSTGPKSINPETGKPYAMDFPLTTIADMVNAQKKLIEHLQIKKLLAVAGGSMGGMQALQWSISFPEMTNSVIALATSASLSAQGIALNEVGRQAIINDPNWNNGNYYDSDSPDAGLSLARMIGHITYLSEKLMHEKFGRKIKDSKLQKKIINPEFSVESYLHYQGFKFVNRFDANSYLYITKAIDFFDLKSDFHDNLTDAFEHVKSNFLIISFSSDWLYPSFMAKEITKALRVNGKNVIFTEIETDKGHDAFLLENPLMEKNISNFLQREFEKQKNYRE